MKHFTFRTGRPKLRGAVVGFLLFGIIGTASVVSAQESWRELDLREAHVLDVTWSGARPDMQFNVTMVHDDDGEAGYADAWHVETLDGRSLGRRDLWHDHGSRPFTRSQTITIPANVTEVVVRAYDQTHGFGGTAMIVNLATGETEAIDQGAEPIDFSRR